MTKSHALQLAVQAKPGMNARACAAAIGITDAKGIARVSALLHQCFLRGKVRREVVNGELCHHPTTLTCVDMRKARRKPDGRTNQRAAQRKRAAAKAAAKPTRAVIAPPKPSPAQVAKVSALFVKPVRLKPAGGAETVDEFLARGGVIERLAPGACSRPLASFADDDLPLL